MGRGDDMKKVATVLVLVVALLVVTVAPSFAGGKGRHGGGWRGPRVRTSIVLGAGPAFWWWYPYPYWYYPAPYYAYPPPPPREPPVYIEQSTQMPQAAPGYWYYCQSASAYYPSVQSCPEAWIRVAPRSE
jgi:hypothetical protein